MQSVPAEGSSPHLIIAAHLPLNSRRLSRLQIRSKMAMATWCHVTNALWSLQLVLVLTALLQGRRAGIAVAPAEDLPSTQGLRGDPRFRANDSYVGSDVPCSYDEKVCFRYNLIYHPAKDTCQALGEGGHSCFLAADRHEFEHGSGHIRGVCRTYDDPCRYFIGYRMAYDGLCYDKDLVFDTLCGCSGGITQHFLGGDECRCESTPIVKVEQPEGDGRCRVPDFRDPLPDQHLFYDHPLRTMDPNNVKLSCEELQRSCFAQGKVHVEGADGCHELLKQGPCPAEHVVALDGRAAEQRQEAVGACVHERGGCPPGQRRMAFDALCHPTRDMDLAAPGNVITNVYGVHEVLVYAVDVLYEPSAKGDTCQVDFLKMWHPIGQRIDLPEAPEHYQDVYSTSPPME